MAGSAHTDLAAYVLGVLDEADNTRFEQHLLDCPHCQLDLVELYQLPDVLDLVKKNWPDPPVPVTPGRTLAPGPRVLRALMAEATVKRKRRRRVGLLAAAAAAALVVAGPLVTLAVRPADAAGPSVSLAAPTSVPPAPPSSLSAPGGGKSAGQGAAALAAHVTVTPEEWGSAVELELTGVAGPVSCQLLAISRAGDIRTVTGWSVPAKGYGVPGSPDPLRVTGGTSLPADQITRFEVRADDGSLLVVVDR
ncbi:zf-HC2 domain-containing protein [Amycolatopsis sp. FDAARGOS 1241]|uniref:zf-HC2 domain-containing protein n=1 Tax=Amycolatopsis sp. FDAARGOS 1241 TaxID=2778070 RepID=UPI0019508024|nr:zf-HC2 domain-containing protein [Amycolatopsis sp. FDAARGOS 1241]QRP43982.1 zf-HC2 domain-containing protein [Amycolatopsis sp. FDAARGOS 1241]